MDRREQYRICQTCLNRRIDLDRGLVCSLTNAKPHFEGECMGYAVDEHVKNEPDTADIQKRKGLISDWLALFLYVMVGLVTVFAVCYTLLKLRDYWGFMNNAKVVVMSVLALLQSIVAVATIRAFYRLQPDAVAWALTYVVCMLVDGVLVFCMLVFEGSWLYIECLLYECLMVFGPIIWLLYLKYSQRVRTVIPPKTRTWRPIQKLVMCLWIAALFMNSYIRVNKLIFKDLYSEYSFFGDYVAILDMEDEVKAKGGKFIQGRDIVRVEFLVDRPAPADTTKRNLYMLGWQIRPNTLEFVAKAKVITESGYRLFVKYVNLQGEVLSEFEYGNSSGRPPMLSPTDEDSGK